MNRFRRSHRFAEHRRGFTLIELLTVIAIISLLAMLLFPVFSRARESGRRAACLSNMKQIGLGMILYLQDYDETFPRQWGNVFYFSSVTVKDPQTGYYANGTYSNATSSTATTSGGVSWPYEILPYIKSTGILACPSAINVVSGDPIWCPSGVSANNCWIATKANAISYDANAVIIRNASNNGAVVQAPLKVAAIPNGSGIALLQENRWKFNGVLTRPHWDNVSKYTYWHSYVHYGNGTYETTSNQHFDGGNILFCDGHVKWRKYTSLTSADFGLHGCTGGDLYNSAIDPINCNGFDQP
jgi:prepilin-type N-terminal cleavage/methylation domain-containing protein/prepilin-type processing-associated H-X9-DG protein